MNDEVTPSQTEGAPEVTPPDDFKSYVKWRETGALPPKEEPATAVAEEQPQVKTEPPSEADDRQESEEEGERTRPNGRSRKIDRLTRDNEQLRARIAALEQPKPAQAAPAEAAKPDLPVQGQAKPRLHDFPTLEAYQEALTDWKIDQREAARKAEAQRAEAKAAEEKLQNAWQSSETAARTAHPDFDEIVQSVRAPEGPGVPAMRQALLEDEAGAEILYYLGKHPDELEKIAAMPLASAAKEIGKLAVKLTPASDSGKPKPQQVSGAPRPPTPLLRPAGSQKKDILDEDFARSDYRGWSKVREAQLKGQ